MNMKKIFTSITTGLGLAAIIPLAASAATQTVLPSTSGWSEADTRTGGEVNFMKDTTAPFGTGALHLITDNTNPAKAQYMTTNHSGTPLSQITNLSYWTKQNAASSPDGDPSYQLGIDTDGNLSTTSDQTFLVYEPYWNDTAAQPVTNGVWQQWDVDAGQFWSSRSVGPLVAGAGGPPFYTLSQVKTDFPNAVVTTIGANVGTFNPAYDTEVDGLQVNTTTYDFEATLTPMHRDDCKNDGWKTFNTPSFRNQGQCVSYVERHSTNIRGNNVHYNAFGLDRRAEFDMNTADNRGTFRYSDANGDWYNVRVTETNTSGDTAWFAGRVTNASNPAWEGQWLFAKVSDNDPDQIWGDFTTQAAAENGVQNMATPASGPFNVTRGNIRVR